MRDLVSYIKSAFGSFPAVITTTPTPVVFDRYGARSLAMLIYVGVGGITFTGTNKIEMVVEDSDDGVTYAAVTTGDILTSAGAVATVASGGIVESYVTAKAAASLNEYGYIGAKRYVRVTPTLGGTHSTGTLVGVTYVAGDLSNRPN